MFLHSRAATAVVLRDCSKEALSYFSNIRSPASFLAGSALASLFLFQDLVKKVKENDSKQTKRMMTTELWILHSYHILMMVAYILSICTIVISTAAGVTILKQDFNVMSTSVYTLLKEHLEFEFVSCRLGFHTSLFCFLLGVTNRAILSFDLLLPSKRHVLGFVCFMFLTLVSHLLAYVNQTLYCWDNLFEMAGSLFKMIYQRMVLEKRPMQIVSFLSLGFAIFHGVKALLLLSKKAEDTTTTTTTTTTDTPPPSSLSSSNEGSSGTK